MARTLADWLELQQGLHSRGIDLGLERVAIVADRLGLLPIRCPAIIVGGTNGKGSTAAHIDTFARAAGLRSGLFTSPHLQRYQERVRVAGEETRDDELVAAFERIDALRAGVSLTFFEFNTLAALQIFAWRSVALAVLEVGLGGRLDATNIVDADVAVLCSVGLDHQEWLGATVEDIGREKAGIFRAHRPVILATDAMPGSVYEAIRVLQAEVWMPGGRYAFERDRASPRWLYRGPYWSFAQLPPSRLAGEIQYQNAAAALAALEALRPRPLLTREAVADALGRVALAGRLQIVGEGPVWILDVAHNEPAAQQLARELVRLPSAGRSYAVCGIFADKDAAGIARALEPVVDEWILCGLGGPRGRSAQALVQQLPASCRVAALCEDVATGCARARALARVSDRIIVFGSFQTVGPALTSLGL